MRPSRLRDQYCAFAGCDVLVLRMSTYCRRHLGVIHGSKSGHRTFKCSAACQRKHKRCPSCEFLCNGSHSRKLRQGLCYIEGAPSCWSAKHGGQGEQLVRWTVTCLLCTRSSDHLTEPPPSGARCEHCGSALLVAEAMLVGGGLRLLRGSERLESSRGSRSESPLCQGF